MSKFYTISGKEITFDFLTKSKTGKDFIDSDGSKKYFDSDKGLEFLLSPIGEKWIIESETGFKTYLEFYDKILEYQNGRNYIIKYFSKNGETDKFNLLKFILDHDMGKKWMSFDYEESKFKEFFCDDDGKVGYDILVEQVGIIWSKSEEGKNIMENIGNKFFKTNYGTKWLSYFGESFLISEQGKRMIIKEGEWIGENVFIYNEDFYDWIVTTPKNIQNSFLDSLSIKDKYSSNMYKWFEKNGEMLFNNKIIGGKFNSFEEYRNDLLRFVYEHENGNPIEKLFKLKEENNDLDNQFVLEFIADWEYGDFWLSFDQNKQIFKELFCENNCETGIEVFKRLKQKETERNVDFMIEYDFPKDTIQNRFWFDSKIGHKMLSFIGNSFFKTSYGKEWLFGFGKNFMESPEFKEWVIREGTWIFNEMNFYMNDYLMFLNWIVTTPETIQELFFNSSYGEYLVINQAFSWFERNGKFLFEKGIIGKKIKSFNGKDNVEVIFDTFDEYKNDLMEEDQKVSLVF